MNKQLSDYLTCKQKKVAEMALFNGDYFLSSIAKEKGVSGICGTSASTQVIKPGESERALLIIGLQINVKNQGNFKEKHDEDRGSIFRGSVVVLPNGELWQNPESEKYSIISGAFHSIDFFDEMPQMFTISNGYGLMRLFIFRDGKIKKCCLRDGKYNRIEVFSDIEFKEDGKMEISFIPSINEFIKNPPENKERKIICLLKGSNFVKV